MTDDQQTRDRVRALVRQALAAATTDDDAPPAASSSAKPAAAPELVAPTTNAATTERTAPLVELRPVAEPPTPELEFTQDESAKTIITESDLRGLETGARLRVSETARFTPSAEDLIRERRIEIVRRSPRRSSDSAAPARRLTVAVGADHGGFEMKGELARFLADSGYHARDFGTHSTEAVDYPDIAHEVARAVAEGAADVGIIIDGAGVGSAMTANKVPGVRAAACYSVAVAKNSREHNGANVLTLGSKTITADEMREIVRAWLSTDLTEERHRRRVAKIEAVERQYRC